MFIPCLNKNNVRYLLVGVWAVGIYGNPRAAKDIDFLIAIDPDNIDNLQCALSKFGVPTVNSEIFLETGNVFRMGRSPIQIDIINQADIEILPMQNFLKATNSDEIETNTGSPGN